MSTPVPQPGELLRRMKRELDVLDRILPSRLMAYDFLDEPYVIQPVSRVDFNFIIFNRESQNWFDNLGIEGLTDMVVRDQLVRPGDVLLDVGCNSGYLTTIFAKLAGSTGRVLSFDPYPWNTLATRYTAELNGLANVEPITAGIGHRDDTILLSLQDSRTHGGGDADAIMAEIHAIERYAARNPTVMKIDVEGAEHEISQADFSRFPALRMIMLELHPIWLEPRGVDPRETLSNFQRHGFSIREFSSPDEEWDLSRTDLAPSMHFFLWRR